MFLLIVDQGIKIAEKNPFYLVIRYIVAWEGVSGNQIFHGFATVEAKDACGFSDFNIAV